MKTPLAIATLRANPRKLLNAGVAILRARAAGTVFGTSWAFLSPLLFMGLYAVIYLLIFRVRVPDLTSFQYVLYVLSGLMPFILTAEAISASASSIAGNTNLLSNTVFPVALMPAQHVVASQGVFVAAGPVILTIAIFTGTASEWMLLVPVVWAFHMFALFGLCWAIAILNVFFRDIQQFIGVALMALLIASPFAYTPDMVPAALKPLIYANPLAYFIIAYQSLIVYGTLPPTEIMIGLVIFALGSFLIGSIVFDRLVPVAIDHV